MKENNVLSMMFAGFLLILAVLITPALNYSLKADDTSQGIIDNAVHTFVDDARKSGKITATDYEQMMSSINIAQPLCDIHITYGKEKCITEDNGTNIYTYHDEYGETQILDVIYTDTGDNEDFMMKKGDYLHVTVQNTTPSFGMKLYSMFIPKAATAKTITTTYGGYVLQNGYDD